MTHYDSARRKGVLLISYKGSLLHGVESIRTRHCRDHSLDPSPFTLVTFEKPWSHAHSDATSGVSPMSPRDTRNHHFLEQGRGMRIHDAPNILRRKLGKERCRRIDSTIQNGDGAVTVGWGPSETKQTHGVGLNTRGRAEVVVETGNESADGENGLARTIELIALLFTPVESSIHQESRSLPS